MREYLTPQEAREIQLSPNPLKRHSQVETHIASIASGTGIDILINPNANDIERASFRKIQVRTLLPLMGRGALVQAAKAEEILDSYGYGKGMEK